MQREFVSKSAKALAKILEPAQVRNVNFAEAIAALERSGFVWDGAGHGVQVHVTQEPIWLAGDRVRLVEVFQNLIDNAVKFMGDQAAPRVEIGIEPADGDQVIFVRDNGKGIDPRYQAKVFGIFEKLDAGAPGSGMGLALVKRIVEQHGGKIGVESEGLGHGTTFRFTLAKTQLRQPAPALT